VIRLARDNRTQGAQYAIIKVPWLVVYVFYVRPGLRRGALLYSLFSAIIHCPCVRVRIHSFSHVYTHCHTSSYVFTRFHYTRFHSIKQADDSTMRSSTSLALFAASAAAQSMSSGSLGAGSATVFNLFEYAPTLTFLGSDATATTYKNDCPSGGGLPSTAAMRKFCFAT
jgi:hypothetical protein